MDFIKLKDWNIEAETGYKPLTTYYMDFSIADAFGEKAIRDTYKRAFTEHKNDYKIFTEIVMVLNWKIWEHHKKNEVFANVYDLLWREADEYAIENFKDDELAYYYQTTD